MIFSYILGKVLNKEEDKIIVDILNIGIAIFVSNPESFDIGKEYQIFVHQIKTEKDDFFVGFKTVYEKKVFEKLISAKGIGSRTALGMMNEAACEEIVDAIAKGDVKFLKKLKGIGTKCAQQLIFDLQDVFSCKEESKKPENYDEVKSILIAFGFKEKQIANALDAIEFKDKPTEEIVRLAIRKMRDLNG